MLLHPIGEMTTTIIIVGVAAVAWVLCVRDLGEVIMQSRSMSFLREQLKAAGFNAEEVSPNEWSMFTTGCAVTVNINDYNGTFQIYITTPNGGCLDIPDTDVFEDDESANLIVEPPGEKHG